MIVVLEKHGHCLCSPVSTYGGRGIHKPGLNKKDIEAHAMVHDRKKKPSLPNARHGMIKEPIAVNLTPGAELHKLSLINFGKIHSVEWNVKVMDIGKVTDQCRDQLVAYFSYETR